MERILQLPVATLRDFSLQIRVGDARNDLTCYMTSFMAACNSDHLDAVQR
jgi:hypothetical protein